MSNLESSLSSLQVSLAAGGIAGLFAALSLTGLTWGLPSRSIDKYLFPDGEVWSGEKIHRLAGASAKFNPARGADVDADPLTSPGIDADLAEKRNDGLVPLTAADEDIAKILIRYRLYTYQPDEMITMMALAGMNPGSIDLDPRLYQYGGLFIYPVGALIKLCRVLGLIDVRGNVIYYLDHPDEFGKFYLVARGYSAAWGVLGVFVVFGIARRLGGNGAGLFAALLYTLMPVVVCMAHEGKPHLPGAVLMLIAVSIAMRLDTYVRGSNRATTRRATKEGARRPRLRRGRSLREWERTNPPQEANHPNSSYRPQSCDPGDFSISGALECTRSATSNAFSFWWMCVACGAATGMVLSSWPICVLIPLVAFRAACASPRTKFTRTIAGSALAIGVYLLTNPYVAINAFVNSEVLRSNFGNSLGMYEISRVGEGFNRVLELTAEGATLPVLLLGLIGFAVFAARRQRAAWPLALSAAVFAFQFVLIGAGKPDEFGRFGVFTNAALAIAAGAIAVGAWTRLHRFIAWSVPLFTIAWVGLHGIGYLQNFRADAAGIGSRIHAAERIMERTDGRELPKTIYLAAEPAPYSCPPLHFSGHDVRLKSPPASGRSQLEIKNALRISIENEKPSWVSYLAPLWRQPGVWIGLDRPTPISWANKPIQVQFPKAD